MLEFRSKKGKLTNLSIMDFKHKIFYVILIYFIINVLAMICLHAVDEGNQGLNGILTLESIIEKAIFIIPGTFLMFLLFYFLIKGKIDFLVSFIISLFFGLPFSYMLIISVSFIFKLIFN